MNPSKPINQLFSGRKDTSSLRRSLLQRTQLFITLLAIFTGFQSDLQAKPRQVLLMRHGHKDITEPSYNLSPLGFQRALALASMLPACFGMPTHIEVYFLDADSGKNGRSYQTAVPLAVASRINIRINRSSMADSKQVGETFLNSAAYENSGLVVFWEHRHLPQLAQGLGWPSMPPIADDDYDLIYQLTYPSQSAAPTVRQWRQSEILAGKQPCTAERPIVFPRSLQR